MLRKKSAQIQANQIALIFVKKIQRSWRKHQFRKSINAHIKLKNRKKMIAMQLKNSQQKYVQNLTMLVNQVVIPSKQPIDDTQLHQLMFSEIQGIQKLHIHFYQKLSEVMSTYKHRQTKISKVIIEDLFNVPDFKSKYSNYCANYAKANKIAKLLFSNNSGLHQLLKKVNILNQNQLDSLMITPMQRLCKYQLILNNYHKNMATDHCDYEDLEQAIQFVEKLVKETNQLVETFLLEDKFRIYKQFHQDILSFIPCKQRKLIFVIEDISEINLVTNVATHYKQLALFNDSLLLLPLGSNTKPIFMKLWYFRDLPNFKYFKNIVQMMNHERYLTIQFKKQKQKQIFLKKMQKTQVNMNQNNFTKVQVLGTQTRQAVFKTYTVYIVEVNNDKNSKKIYPRFKDLLKVQQIIQYKKGHSNLPSLTKQSLFSTLKSKTIQRRKLVVQQFLQKVANTPELYLIPQVRKILNFGFASKINNNNNNLKQLIINLPSGQQINIFIGIQGTCVNDIKTAIAEKLGLNYADQFELFQVRNKARRLLYSDQLASQIYKQQQSNVNSLNPFKDSLSYLYTRHHYLQQEDEFETYKNDFVRTELELSVIKSQIRNYLLQQELMITFMCLFAMYINLPVWDEKQLSNFLKQIGKKQYKVSIQDFKSYYSQVQKKVEEQQDETVTIPFLIIQIMNNSFLYHCQQFQVAIHAKSFKQIKKCIPGIEDKIILGIKRTHILLLTPQSKHIVQSFPMQSVQIAQMYPTALILKLQNVDPPLRLNTNSGFEISRLFEIYKGKV